MSDELENVHKYCDTLRKWADLMQARDFDAFTVSNEAFRKAREIIELAATKSCLLDRMLGCGEGISQTPCPVHKGRWAGVHFGWPGSHWVDKQGNKKTMDVPDHLQKWYDAGCRCFQHKCGCTTGWQPDEHCGCKPKQESTQ